MSEGDWLTQEFQQAEREYRELPESARPVVIPAMDVADSDAASFTESSSIGEPRPASE